jgi:hypothetical protein
MHISRWFIITKYIISGRNDYVYVFTSTPEVRSKHSNLMELNLNNLVAILWSWEILLYRYPML